MDDLRVGTTFADVVSNAPPLSRQLIISQPQNQTVTNGGDVTFSVSATGTPPLGLSMAIHPGIRCRDGRHQSSGGGEFQSHADGSDFRPGRFLFRCASPTPLGSTISDPAALSVWCAAPPAFSYLTYNVHGNGLTNWSTNMWHVQAIGRQMQYLDPDIITFNEIPVTNNCTAQMADFVAAFRPGYYLVTNSADDGFIRSVILSRFPSSPRAVGCTAPISRPSATPIRPVSPAICSKRRFPCPAFPQPLHVFSAHLKSGQDADSAAKRSAEAGAVSNFFATVYLPAHGEKPYVLSGDMNEDILRPPASNPQSLQRLISTPTGLHLTTAINPFTGSELTWSIQDTNTGPTVRYDYILPCAMLSSNIVSSQVFRTDLLTPLPPNLYSNDDKTASDHLPVFMVFANPFNVPFRLLSVGMTNHIVSLKWESQSNRSYNIEVSSNLITWTPLASNLIATGAELHFSNQYFRARPKFFRVCRVP